MTNIPDRLSRPREPLPNLRGEDETEITYLTNLIETLSWILFPSKHPTCVLGRNPRSVDSSSLFCASLYTMGKGGVICLDIGPEMGETRKEVLTKLLGVVEIEIGKMMLWDGKQRDRERERGGALLK
ncbi:Nn.00g001830.m01.CDS01 [Neocucurbitaria sp. VM-36]